MRTSSVEPYHMRPRGTQHGGLKSMYHSVLVSKNRPSGPFVPGSVMSHLQGQNPAGPQMNRASHRTTHLLDLLSSGQYLAILRYRLNGEITGVH